MHTAETFILFDAAAFSRASSRTREAGELASPASRAEELLPDVVTESLAIARSALSRGWCGATVDDIAAEVTSGLWRLRPGVFSLADNHRRAIVRLAAKRAATDAFRKHSRYSARLRRAAAAGSIRGCPNWSGGSDALAEVDRADAIGAWFRKLTKTDRRLVVLVLRDWSISAIADRLRISKHRVQTRLARLRPSYAKYFGISVRGV